MHNDILKKLTGVLVEPIRSEMQVVYILVEIRKLLELEDPKHVHYGVLGFHCDWVVHVKLDRNPIALELITRLNDFERLVADGNVNAFYGVNPPKGTVDDIMEAAVQVIGRLEFVNLRVELAKFAQTHDLPVNFLSDERWSDFLTHYAGVIGDVPLVAKAKGNTFEYVDQITLKLADAAMANCSIAGNWSYTLKQPPYESRVMPLRL